METSEHESIKRCSAQASRQRGFTYMGVLIMIAAMGLAFATIGELWRATSQREKEKELLFIGNEFRRAIGMYYTNSPGLAQYPKKLEDLLLDERYPNVRRYLRKMYVDPMTGKREWGLVRTPEGITGVYSLSKAEAYKTTGFDNADSVFEGATSYESWRFVYIPAATAAGQTGTPPVGSPNAPSVGAPPAVPVANPGPPPERGDPSECARRRAADIQACNRNGSFVENPAIAECVRAATNQHNRCLAGTN